MTSDVNLASALNVNNELLTTTDNSEEKVDGDELSLIQDIMCGSWVSFQRHESARSLAKHLSPSYLLCQPLETVTSIRFTTLTLKGGIVYGQHGLTGIRFPTREAHAGLPRGLAVSVREVERMSTLSSRRWPVRRTHSQGRKK